MTATKPLIQCDVKMFGALDPDGDEMKGCRLTMLGEPVTAVLYGRNNDEKRWVPIDRLTNAKVTDGNGSFILEGTSDELVEIVGLEAKDATVRWEVTPRGCRDCG